MVMGIGEGKIDLVLDSTAVQSGGKITGKLKLELNSPTKARELRVEVLGKQWQSHTEFRGGRSHHTRSQVIVYTDKKVLGSAETFSTNEYPFEFVAPAVEKPQASEGIMGAISGFAKAVGMGPAPIEYYVKGTLDLEMAFDINKEVRINIS